MEDNSPLNHLSPNTATISARPPTSAPPSSLASICCRYATICGRAIFSAWLLWSRCSYAAVEEEGEAAFAAHPPPARLLLHPPLQRRAMMLRLHPPPLHHLYFNPHFHQSHPRVAAKQSAGVARSEYVRTYRLLENRLNSQKRRASVGPTGLRNVT